MSDRQNSNPENKVQQMLWPLGLLAAFYAIVLLARPDLFWQLLAGFVICVAFLGYFVRGKERSADTEERSRDDRKRFGTSYQALIDALQFPAYLLDRDANVQYANRHAIATFGTVRAGDRISNRFRQPELRKTIERALSQRSAVIEEFNEAVPHDRWFQVEISPVAIADPTLDDDRVLFLLAFHDHTEAHRTDRMRSDFIANASHELRTPLASLLGYIETIRGPAKDDPDAQKRFTGIMQEQAERMTRLVNDLLSLSRIEMKSHVKPADRVDIAEVLNSVVSSLEPLIEQTAMAVELEVEKDLAVIGDRDELIQVFANLVENACKYGQEGKKVIITAKKSGTPASPTATVIVKDFGIGIAVEHQQRITERFYRVDVARSREKQGTGLGLAIVKHILNRHGSRLNLKSVPGEGTEFYVVLKTPESERPGNQQ